MSEPAPAHRWLVTATGMTAAFTMVLSGTIVNVAVPHVMGAFGVGQDRAQFLATAYIATMTASQLLNSWFVGTFGPRLAFALVLAIYTAGAGLCIVSPGLDLIIVGRIMQGFAAGVVQPLVMVSIFRAFPERQRGMAMGIYSVGLVAALGLGPVVGGITIDALSWRYIFWVPLPLVVTAFVLGAMYLPPGRPGTRLPFDWTGYGLLCAALFCVMSAVADGPREGWTSNVIVGEALVGVTCAIAFVRSQLRPGASLLDVSLFRSPRFAAAALVTAVYGVGNFCVTYVVPVCGQLVQGYTPTLAGLLLLPAAVVLVGAFPFTGRLADTVPARVLIPCGLLMFATGAFLLSGIDAASTFWVVAGYAVVARLGMGFITPPLMKAALAAVPPEKLNYGGGTINFCRQLGGALGINTLVAVLELRTRMHGDALTATQTADNSTTRELLGLAERLLANGGVAKAARHALALDHLGRMIEAQAETLAFQDGFLLIAAVFVLALVPAWLLGRT